MNCSKQLIKTILVTGGAGFLGSHLCDSLVNKGHRVICLDNLYTGSKNNIKHLLPTANFSFVEHDVCDPFSRNFNEKIDEIYHLACPASPVHYQAEPIKTIETSVIGTRNFLKLAKENDARLLHASTSEVYGDPLMHPQQESYWGNVNPIGPRACYDEGKRCAETLAFEYYRQYQLEIKVVRIFNTYGPRMHQHDGRVVSNFIVQALKGENITVYGDGSQTRSFCYVDDLIDGFVNAMQTPADFIGPMNLGNSNEVTVLELAKIIINLTNSRSKILFQELPQDDPVRRKPDATLAKNMMNWAAHIALEVGLKQTIEYFEQLLNITKMDCV